MNTPGEHTFSITLQGREVDIARRMMPHVELRFFLQNPRVYSLVRQEGEEPDQEDILDALGKMEHVKQLVQAIKQNSGLTDPLLVRGSDNVVLEGNSRLAAYRLLARHEPVQWGLVKCDVVVAPISDSEVKALLTHYHIVGRKSWDPYEQAGMFWRWYREGFSLEEISKRVEELGISSKKIRHWIAVYSMMVENNATGAGQWSYYDEFLKSRHIQKAIQDHPELPAVFVQKMRTGEIKKAVDVRDKVAKIAKAGGRPLSKFVEKRGSIDACFEHAVAGGATDILYNKMRKFREVVADPSAKQDLCAMPAALRSKCAFELKRIASSVGRLLAAAERGK